MTFDGKVLRVWKPDHGIDDTTSEILDGDFDFSGNVDGSGKHEPGRCRYSIETE